MSLEEKAIKIKGKSYVLVSDRVIAFNETYPNGSIVVELISQPQDDMVVMKATVTPDTNHPERKFVDYSQARWGDGYINKTSAMENCSTSAVGRALGMMGIGVIESIASVDEINKAQTYPQKKNTPYKDEFYDDSKKDTKNDKRIDDIEQDDVKKGGSPMQKRVEEIEEKRKLWEKIKEYIETDINPNAKSIYDVALKQYGVDKFSQMTLEQCKYTVENILDFVNPENIFDKE